MFRRRRRTAMEWPELDRDPAYDDLAMRVARGRLAQGDWGAARDVLDATGGDTALRAARVRELARLADDGREPHAGRPAAAGGREPDAAQPAAIGDGREPDAAQPASAAGGWLRAWLDEAPEEPAAVLVDGAAKARRGEPDAEEVLRQAAALAPRDPSPWVEVLWLLVGRGVQSDRRAFAAALREVKQRDPHNHPAHRAAMAFAGSDRERFAVARLGAQTAPSGAAAGVLPVEAHVAFARRTIREPGGWDRRTLVALRRYFRRDEVHDEIVAGTERWRQGRGPRAVAPRHHEALAYFFADDRERLRMVIEEIHPYLGDGHPWNHFAEDGRGDILYVVARNTALNG
ncbi:hypothetical protein ACFFX1_17025 [Dactylosporangium sucinum]|uniref:Tetratricopeptide repeat protein n=1 Tax=Dactylosporangium sucinum TaxID=1424081 RepID=A0A917X2T4_9ACTN|nr:hypothetical protein [Dactylosporangium sucinum]GGM57899.1 hypothetical protein GCM10007977_069430 [Dactylosporangium sucinum]